MSNEKHRKVQSDAKTGLANSCVKIPDVTRRSESVQFATTANLPSGMANLLLSERDARHRDACDEVARLDEVLKAAALKERRVKRDRAVLEMKLSHELEQLKAGKSEAAADPEELENTAKFLALMRSDLPRRSDQSQHNQPVFATECPEFEASVDDFGGEISEGRPRTVGPAPTENRRHAALTCGKDFVRQNIQLAADPSKRALAPEDQARLDGLLRDLDQTRERLPEEADEDESEAGAGDFERDRAARQDPEFSRLMEIEHRLERLNNRVGVGEGADSGRSTAPGDPALAAARAERLMERRLAGINARLAGAGSSSAAASPRA